MYDAIVNVKLISDCNTYETNRVWPRQAGWNDVKPKQHPIVIPACHRQE